MIGSQDCLLICAGYLLPPHVSAASASGPTKAAHAARLKAHAVQSCWLASAVNWQRFGGAPPPTPPSHSSNPQGLAPSRHLSPHNPPEESSALSHGLPSAEAAAAVPEHSNNPSGSLGRPASVDAAGSGAAAAAIGVAGMTVQSQAIAAQLAWERCPSAMMDLRLPKGSRMHGRHSNDVDGIAALRGRTLDDPRASFFYMLMAYPQTHPFLRTAEQIKAVGRSRAQELAVTLTQQGQDCR